MLFKTKRFGAFLHFGLYAVNAWHEQDQLRRAIPKEEYTRLAERFDPERFDADAWVRELKEAGAEYICFTAKHHDGFCMWDTKHTDYNIMHTPFGRDLLKELSLACEKHGVYLELYYSCPDWHHKNSENFGEESHQLPCPNEGDEPNDDLYVEYVKNQMRELLTRYGKIHGLFWDIPPKREDPSVNALVRTLQPHILINDRGYDKGDYSTPEREAFIANANFSRLCEACQSVGMQAWGYRKEEDYFTAASLISSVSGILMKGGNYLLNVGPMADGTLPSKSMEIFRAVGDWYRRIRESVIGTEFLKLGRFNYTRKDNTLYLFLPSYFSCSGVVLKPITTAPKRATLLNTGNVISAVAEYTPVDFDYKKNTPHLHLSGIPADALLRETIVIKLEFDDLSAVLETLSQNEKLIL